MYNSAVQLTSNNFSLTNCSNYHVFNESSVSEWMYSYPCFHTTSCAILTALHDSNKMQVNAANMYKQNILLCSLTPSGWHPGAQTCKSSNNFYELYFIKCICWWTYWMRTETLIQWGVSCVAVGARRSAVGWGTALQIGRSQVRFPMVSLELFIDIILPAALWPWGWLSL